MEVRLISPLQHSHGGRRAQVAVVIHRVAMAGKHEGLSLSFSLSHTYARAHTRTHTHTPVKLPVDNRWAVFVGLTGDSGAGVRVNRCGQVDRTYPQLGAPVAAHVSALLWVTTASRRATEQRGYDHRELLLLMMMRRRRRRMVLMMLLLLRASYWHWTERPTLSSRDRPVWLSFWRSVCLSVWVSVCLQRNAVEAVARSASPRKVSLSSVERCWDCVRCLSALLGACSD